MNKQIKPYQKTSSVRFVWGKRNNIFSFDNYRAIIRSYMKERGQLDRTFGLKVFAKETGHKAKSFYPNVIHGRRKATTETILAIARVMKLSKKETRYFVNLANYEDAKNEEVRKFYAGELKRDTKNKLR